MLYDGIWTNHIVASFPTLLFLIFQHLSSTMDLISVTWMYALMIELRTESSDPLYTTKHNVNILP